MLNHSGHVMTLANSIIGVGILAMPFCFQKCGVVLAIVLLVVNNWITRISCHYLIKSSFLTRRRSFEFLGFHAFGSSGKMLVELCIIGYLFGTCITYFVVVGDLGPQIVTKMLSLSDGHVHLRTLIMVGVTVVCILPLGMLKNVDSLSTVCTASIGFYVCLVVKIVLESNDRIVANDWMPKVMYWEPAGIMQCLPIFSMALSCQMQLFEVFESISNQSVEKLNGIVRNATWICTFVYIAVGFFGYVAFCMQDFSGNILLNLSTSFGSDVIKIGFILSVAFSFPLVIFPCRASIYSLLYRKGHTDATGYIPETRFKVITTSIVGSALCIALMIPSVELVIGLVGSTIGVAICIMFPALCYRKIVKKESFERSLAQFIFVSGFCLMILGTYANLHAIDVKRSGAHLQIANLEDEIIQPTVIPNFISHKDTFVKEKKNNEPLPFENVKIEENLAKPKSKANIENPVDMKQIKIQPQTPLGNVAEPSKLPDPPSPGQAQPLPVDEKHDETDNAQNEVKEIANDKEEEHDKPGKLAVVSPLPEVIEIKPLEGNKTMIKDDNNDKFKNLPKINVPTVPVVEPIKTEDLNNKPAAQQTVDKEAIKKEDDIVAEEQKNNKDAKSNEDELKKTQKELKQTKELLERTVDELKEELAKQNKETQNLVVEKLGEVVEKVEQIERKVQQKDEDKPAAQEAAIEKKSEVRELSGVEMPFKNVPKNEPLVPNRVDPKGPAQQAQMKGTLLSILSEQPALKAAPAPGQVYEPLSYKTGELIEHAKNGTKLEQRLPLPLALLINASQAKLNDVGTRQTNDHVPVQQANAEPVVKAFNQEPPKKAKSDNVSQVEMNVKAAPAAVPPKNVDDTLKADRENVDAIRRDILQVKDYDAIPTDVGQRHKRSIEKAALNFEAIDKELQQKNCLTEPKIDTLMSHGSSVAIDFKIHGIGRDLKSLKDEQND